MSDANTEIARDQRDFEARIESLKSDSMTPQPTTALSAEELMINNWVKRLSNLNP